MLPATGRPVADLLAELDRLKAADLPTRGENVTAYVYDSGRPEVREAAERAYLAMLEVNSLDPTAFPSTVALERAVVAAVASRLGGDAATPGIFTSGGTESIMLAVKAARDARPDIAAPRMVVPVTAHAAFHKAGAYLRVAMDTVPVDPATFRADPQAMAAACTQDTVLVVASAPSYAQGVVDPIEEIAAVAAERNLPCHVDACVGGWLLPWLADAGAEIPAFDLSVPGVTSISCDLHKFGYAPKGASVLLFRDAAMRMAAYYACAAWPGYPIVNSTVQSSKGAGPLAGAWATLQALGEDGYRQLGREALEATRRLVEGIAQIEGLEVLGTPQATLVAIGSSTLDLFALADRSRARGFFLQPQMAVDGLPASVHITLTGVSAAGIDSMLTALAEAASDLRADGPAKPRTDLVELVAQLDLEHMDDATFASLLPAAGWETAVAPAPAGESGEGGDAVERGEAGAPAMAAINNLLNALPPHQRELIIKRFISVLYSPHLDA
ncbi:aspartate aminotransferase family protein [Actinospica durhamensis]|uniref:Aspartate aminotransferase family protein n=1 Tax=Actinospica durhamensis TaxID=1508375 RepID=A0A941EUZ1_9ACTN|nr:aspartate aminotransferase family protein [Actinospica durhamensis]MBR7836872.1 aspartate aminotransferase family protein [Actinospica durhamensis]